ncbi:hypothetical protein IV203_030288 [Nitzschia inconspicua]|uniref:Uncharacterized protein n=1 Tax=Nitzschia inconspicua TaxID=303405 RepID=A0A9K3Q156_9STRA|nr:hypothetical protein IV203_030288 [Nitzschia inconspicua]
MADDNNSSNDDIILMDCDDEDNDDDDDLFRFSSTFKTSLQQQTSRYNSTTRTRSILKKNTIFCNPNNNNNKNRPPKKSVQFSVMSEQVLIPNRDDWTEQERYDAFFTIDDYRRIKQDNQYTLSAMNRGIFPDDTQETFRGLENGMDDYYNERKHTIATTVSSIIRMQRKQWELDPRWMEHVYSRYTERSLMFALRAGNFDAHTAAAIQQEEEERSDTSSYYY